MELCYEGGLVMPSSYAIMDEEEMTYVEGGGLLKDIAVNILCGLVGSALWEYRASIISAGVKACISAYGWVCSVVSSAAAWAIANPVAAAVILGAVTGTVIAFIKYRY